MSSYDDLMMARTHDGPAFAILNVLNEYTGECPDISDEQKIASHMPIESRPPVHDKGHTRPPTIGKPAGVHGGGTIVAYEAQGGNPSHRTEEPRGEPLQRIVEREAEDEPLDRETFAPLPEGEALTENWRKGYNTARRRIPL